MTRRARRLAQSMLGVVSIVGLAVVAPPVAGLGASPAGASEAPCIVGLNCQPSNVNFEQPGNFSIAGVHVCGLENSYAPLGSSMVDASLDDPAGIGQPTSEGNYTDSQAIQFQPASNTSLSSGDTVTVALPHPAEPYANAGSVLPPPQVGANGYSEQNSSTVQTTLQFIANNQQQDYVAVHVAGAGAGTKIRLDAFNPYSPPAVINAPGPHVGGNTSASIQGYDATNSHYDTGQITTTDATGTAYFEVTDGAQETIVLGATDVTASNSQFWAGFLNTDTINFNGGTPSGSQNNQLCSPTSLTSSGLTSGDGFTYLLVENNVGYVVPSVNVSTASSTEQATLTVPNGFPTTQGQVTLVVLDATSPPGGGTPQNSLQSPDTPYPPADFTVQTSEDPVPGSPNNAPTFQADANGNLPWFPVDPYTSTVTSSEQSAEVGTSSNVTATATFNDAYNNPVNDKQVVLYQGSGTHAAIAPQTPPMNSTYPKTDATGSVTYSVSDSCVETVNLSAVDIDDNIPAYGSASTPSVSFTPAPAVAPDASVTSTNCGTPPVRSAISVTVGATTTPAGSVVPVPADGTTPATVTVTLGDQFGNADSCQQVVLSAASRTSHASITGLDPTNPCPGDNLPGYTGTDGVARFSVTDSAAESVVLGVTDTTVVAAWPSSATSNPLDVAQLQFQGADAGQSTVVASTSSAPADGQPAATVTVTLKDAGGQTLQGKQVELLACTNNPTVSTPCTTDPTATVTPSLQSTGAGGTAQFSIADNATTLPHPVYFQAIDTSDNVAVTETATITFQHGGASLGVSPPTVVADGVGTTTVTFELQDTSGNPVSGVNVSLAASPSGATILPGSTTTNGAGQAAFTVSSAQAGKVELTATATYTATPSTCLGVLSGTTCTVTATSPVTFLAQPATFAITASPATNVPADGFTNSQVTVTALDAHGNPIAGLPVVLSAAGSASGTPSITPQGATTGANGQATFSITDTTAETDTLSAGYTEIGGATVHPASSCTGSVCNATVMFVPTEAEASTIATTGGSSAPANGHSTVTVTVTLLSGAGTPINGHNVVLSTGSTTTTVTPSNAGGYTGVSAPGQVSFTLSDSKPETLTIHARDTTTGALLVGTVTVTFAATEVQLSTVVAVPATLAASGPPGSPDTSTVTVTLVGPTCTASDVGETISLATPSGTAVVSGPAVTATGGVARFTVSDPIVESVVLTATDATCGVTLAQTATVQFTASEANQSSVAANPVSTPAQGTPSTVTVTLRTAAGAPLSGRTVTVPAVGHAVVTPLSWPGLAPGETNPSGQAQFSVADATVEAVTLAAYDGATELDQTATITFTANEANQSTITASPTSLPAGLPTTTVTVTLRTGGGLPISGDVVALTTPSTTASISPATATTSAGGVATFTVSDSKPESLVLGVLDRTTGVTLDATATVAFTANEQNQSTISSNTTVATVKKTATITVTLLSAAGAPLVGHAVKLATGSTTTTVTCLTKTCLTSSTGQLQFTVTDSVAQTITISATDTTAGVTLYKTVSVTYVKP